MEHSEQILQELPNVSWFEILIDNYMAENAPLSVIDKLVEDYPISFHGVGLSVGSIAPIDYQYLNKLKELRERWQPAQYSDHLAWTGTAQHHFHELLPLPATKESIQHLAEKISRIQDFMGAQILMENASTYIEAPAEMKEWEFINEVCSASGCALLLDINNIHVNAFNHGFSVADYIKGIDLSNVREIHLAGYEERGDYYFDSHSKPVEDQVWKTYQSVIARIPNMPTLVEWDSEIPELKVLMEEIKKAELIRQSVLQTEYQQLEPAEL